MTATALRPEIARELSLRRPLNLVPLALRSKEVVLAAVRRDGEDLKYAPYDCLVDRGILLAAVSQNGLSVRHALQNERDDKEIALAAVRSRGDAIDFLPALQNDRDVQLAAMQSEHKAHSQPPGACGDKELAVAYVAHKAPDAVFELHPLFLPL